MSAVRCIAVLLCLLFINGCAVLQPSVQITPRYTASEDDPKTKRPLTAHERADLAIAELQDKAVSHQRFEFWSGAALIATGLVGAGIGLFEGPRDALLGTALAGGTILGARAYVPSAARQRIYQQGITAIYCVKSDTNSSAETNIGGGDQETTTVLSSLSTRNQLSGSLSALDSVRVNVRRNAPSLAGTLSTTSLEVQRLVNTTDEANDAIGNLENAVSTSTAEPDRRLNDAVDLINQAVNRRIREGAVDAKDALQIALSGISGSTDAAKAAYQAARDAVGKKKEQATRTEEAAAQTEREATAEENAARAAGDNGGVVAAVAVKESAQDIRGLARQLSAEADKQDKQLMEAFGNIGVSLDCLGELSS